MKWRRTAATLVASVALAGMVVPACTAFNDTVVPGIEPGGDGGAAASPSGAGAGGAGPSSGSAGAPVGGGGGAGGVDPLGQVFLSVDDAVEVCGWVFECPLLGPSIRASIGVPVGPEATFSHCVNWLAGPLPENYVITSGQREMFGAMAAADSCEDALGAAYIELLEEGDPRCPNNARVCSENNEEVIQCNGSRRQIERCGSPLVGKTVCSVNGTPTCSEKVAAIAGTYCQGANLVYAIPLAEETAGCRERGLTCKEGGLVDYCGDVDGIKPGCNTPGQTTCVDGVAKVCAGPVGTADDLLFTPFDCKQIAGASCHEDGPLRCEVDGGGCQIADGDACDGNVIHVCVGGNEETRDCAAIGRSCTGTPAACR